MANRKTDRMFHWETFYTELEKTVCDQRVFFLGHFLTTCSDVGYVLKPNEDQAVLEDGFGCSAGF